jgi:threonine aldolase
VETRIGALSIESPVRRRDHEMVDFAELERVCGYARAQGIRLHLDGARLFNLPFHSGKGLRDYADLFDTVYVSLWKHFNGASGAILAGDAAFIKGLFHTRRMFGGALPHAWPQVALVARYVDDYEAQYARAWQAADELIALLQADDRFAVRKPANGTCRFFVTVKNAAPEAFIARALQRGVVFSLPPAGSDAFSLQVNATILRRPVSELVRIFRDSMKS